MSNLNSELLYRYSKTKQNKPGFSVVKGEPYKTLFEISDPCKNDILFATYCTISCFGKYDCFADSLLKRNPVSTFDLIYISKGEAIVNYSKNDKNMKDMIRTGDVFIAPLNCSYHIAPKKNSTIILLSHYGVIGEKYYEFICRKEPCRIVPMSHDTSFQVYLDNLYFYAEYAFQVNKILAINTLIQIFTKIYLSSLNPEEYNTLGQPSWIQQALYYMENNYMHKITVADVAGACGLSASYFHKLFNEYTGQSPYDYLKKIRLTRARTMLLESNDLIKQIAISVGMPSTNHFIEAFKKETGLSPENYRMKYKK